MDFIDLANGLPEVTKTLLRHLALKPAGDDDFARLDGEHEVAQQQNQQQQQYGNESSSSNYNYYAYSPEDLGTEVQHPFLSKTAEAELYLLATNFLLCKSF
jgi:hypothetical protein